MQRFLGTMAIVLALVCAAAAARAEIVVTVDKTAQRLTVDVDGARRYDWPVSTARWGYRTPNGSYRPERLERSWYSRKYDWSPMPHSIFFSGGYAIHGSYEISRLGRPASHGCIRLHPNNAKTLFEMVQSHVRQTRIVIMGDSAPGVARELAPAHALTPARESASARVRYPSRRFNEDQTFQYVFDPYDRYYAPRGRY